jgi:hypothetical protein
MSLESWSDAPITNVILRDVSVEFNGGGAAEDSKLPVKGPGVDVRRLPAWGIYARNLEQLTLEDLRFSLVEGDLRPVAMADRVRLLNLDNVRFPRVPGVTESIVTTNVGKLNILNSDRANSP